MARKDEINEFLKFMYKYFKKNRINPNEDTVYQGLMNYDFASNELNVGTAGLFGPWIDRFMNTPNIRVYHDQRQANFLQFHNGENYSSKHIKLYVSLSPNAIYEGVNLIFDFIAKNNMKTLSKVANRVRSDEIVLRMESTDDAEKLINFINSNSYLRDNAKCTNPFLNREGIVGIGYDDLLSYNQTVAHFVSEYLSVTKKPSYDDFVNFMNNKYINLFQNQSELGEFTNSELFKENLARITQGFSFINNPELYIINNYRIVFGAILNNTYMDSYKNLYGMIDESKNIFSQMTNVDQVSLLNSYIQYAFEKYGHRLDVIVGCLSNYQGDQVNGPNVNAITRDNNFRNMFIYNINPNKIGVLTNNNIENYVRTVLSYDRQNNVAYPTEELFNEDDFNIFIEGLRTTYLAHGEGQLLASIDQLLDGNFQVMSNGSFGYRNYFKQKYNQDSLGLLANRYFTKIVGDRTVSEDLSAQIVGILKDEYGFESRGRTH